MSTGLITLSDITNKYKASGVYFTHRDGTAVPTVAGNEPVRLIAGFSRTGVFNVPVLIQKGDYDTARKLFGTRDRVLERQGSFFHKSIEVALASGSVLALNLLKTNNSVDEQGNPTQGADVVEFKTFSLDPSTPNGETHNKLLASYYNKTRFWKPDPKYLTANGTVLDKQSRLLSLTNLSKSPVSVLIRKSSVKGFDVTALEWYKDVELIPAFMKTSDLISDYFIDVIVLSGDFSASQYPVLASHPVFGKYFTATGLKKDLLEEFLNLKEVKVKQIYTGTVIPNFVDGNGINRNIQNLINSNTNFDGLLCAINEKELDKYITKTNTAHLDLVGNRLLEKPVEEINFLSYKGGLVDKIETAVVKKDEKLYFSVDGSNVVTSGTETTVTIPNTDPFFEQIYSTVGVGSLIPAENNVMGEVRSIDKTAQSVTLKVGVQNPAVTTYTLKGVALPEEAYKQVTLPEDTTKITVSAGKKVSNRFDTSILNEHEVTLKSSTIAERLAELMAGIEDTLMSAGIAVTNKSPLLNFTNNTQVAHKITLKVTSGSGDTEFSVEIPAEKSASALMTDGTKFLKWYTINPTPVDVQVKNNKLVISHLAPLYKRIKEKNIITGDYYDYNGEKTYLKVEFGFTEEGERVCIVSGYQDMEFMTEKPITEDMVNHGKVVSGKGTSVVTLPIRRKQDETTVVVDKAYKDYLKVGQFLVAEDNGKPTLARIISIKNDMDAGQPTLLVSTNGNVKLSQGNEIERRLPLEDMFSEYDLSCLKGFSLKDHHLPNNTDQRVREIYSVMTDTVMAKTLVDPEMVDFRYFVDTFNKGLTPESKSYLSKLIQTRQRCLGILNCPTPEEFMDSTDPRFTNTPSAEDPFPGLSAELINKGGNVDENPSFLYTLPQEVSGASYVGYYFPNIEVRNDDGSLSSVPPACYVSNNFVEKYKSNPYLAVAGMKRGIISGEGVTGVTLPLSKSDRGELEEKGINPIYRRNDGSIVIMGNETGFQKYTSILNNIHARETLINIEIDQEQLLAGFMFEYNDDTMRTQVLSILDNYYSNLRDIYGCIEEFEVVFDRSNNPDWVVRENTSIVDVIVKIPNVTKKFINRITLSGNSAIVGSFTAV